MLARDRGRPRGLRLLQPEVEAVVEEQVRGYYATAQKPSKQSLFEAIRRECRRRGLTPPGNETVRRRLRATDPVAIAAGRHGRKVARDRHGPAKEHFEPSTQLLGLVEIDHTRVDLIVVDDAYREPIGRPWLTLAIDVLSRAVIGYHLTLEAPSSLSVALCMAHVVSDKAPWLAQRGIEAACGQGAYPRQSISTTPASSTPAHRCVAARSTASSSTITRSPPRITAGTSNGWSAR